MKKRLKTLTILFIGIILISMVTAGCSRDSSSSDEGVYTSVSELSGKRIGVQMGSIFDSVSRENIPDAQILYFSTFPDIVMALKSNKIDAFPNLRMVQTQYMHTDDSVTIIDEEIGRNPAGYVFPKNKKGAALRDQMNEFLQNLTESGELGQIEEKWCEKDESKKTMIDYTELPDINGKLTFLTEGTFPPFSYLREDLVVGYAVDIAARF